MSANSPVVEQYLRQVGQALDCPRSQKKVILEQLQSSLADVPEIEQKNLEDIYEIAGKPDEITPFCMKEKGQGNVVRNLKSRMRFRWFMVVIVAISIVTVLILYGIYVFGAVDYAHGYLEVSSATTEEYVVPADALETH